MISALEVEENFFLLYCLGQSQLYISRTMDEFFILPVYLVALGTIILLALNIFRKSIGRLLYLQVKFSPKSQYNLLDLLFISEQMHTFELNLAF